MIAFDNSYSRLPERAFARLTPQHVTAPRLIVLNTKLATELGLDPDFLKGEDGLSMLAGNRWPEGAAPLAQAYAGHQFGHLSPQLGDGRAALLGEVVTSQGDRFDIALKGSGRTPFSRNGDGRAWLGPVLREYIVSEFMAAAGVPTTRALAAVATGEQIQRQTALPGAILTRVAESHLRIGTFEYFAVRGDAEMLHMLADMAIVRHYPEAEGPLGLLQAVVSAQAELVAKWMALGFIHGVMNTDNMSISGETIDYGPCAFLDGYHPDKVFSSIDRHGRYAWSEQPHVAVWNLAQLASCLVPLIGADQASVDAATAAVHAFPEIYQTAWLRAFAAKIGIEHPRAEDRALIEELLTLMATGRSDFTATFTSLDPQSPSKTQAYITDRAGFAQWHQRWQARLTECADARQVMARANPRRIPRNHHIEQVIAAAVSGDEAPFHAMLAAVEQPFTDRPDWDRFGQPPTEDEQVRATFCGT